jgi:hypothetical protein
MFIQDCQEIALRKVKLSSKWQKKENFGINM